jgi:hypothetical protein
MSDNENSQDAGSSPAKRTIFPLETRKTVLRHILRAKSANNVISPRAVFGVRAQ